MEKLNIRRLRFAAAAGVASIGFAACDASSGFAATGTSAAASEPGQLTIDIVSPNTNFAAVFIAKSEGEFAKQDLNVNILENTGSNTLPLLSSGKADLTLYAFPNPLIMASQGQSTSVILNGLRDSGASLAGSRNISSMAALRARGSDCKIATTAPGSQGYGYAVLYTTAKSLGLQKCTIEPAASTDVAIARLASGQVDAVSLPQTYLQTVLKQTGAHMLISSSAANFRKSLNLPNFVSAEYFGITKTLRSKRALIVRFIKAINATDALMVPKNVPRLARDLHTYASFNTVPIATLETSLRLILPYLGAGANYASPAQIKANPGALTSSPGYIPKSVWNTSLSQIAKWGVQGYKASASTNAYGQRVDMSYLKSALGK